MLAQMIPAMITTNTLNSIYSYFNDFSVEKGGALAVKDGVVIGFYPISNLDSNAKCYSPSFAELNAALEGFERQGFSFGGIIHSHINGSNKPSKEDRDFFKSFLETNNQFESLLFPIIYLKNGNKDIAWYLVNDKGISKVDIKIEL